MGDVAIALLKNGDHNPPYYHIYALSSHALQSIFTVTMPSLHPCTIPSQPLQSCRSRYTLTLRLCEHTEDAFGAGLGQPELVFGPLQLGTQLLHAGLGGGQADLELRGHRRRRVGDGGGLRRGRAGHRSLGDMLQ